MPPGQLIDKECINLTIVSQSTSQTWLVKSSWTPYARFRSSLLQFRARLHVHRVIVGKVAISPESLSCVS